MSSVRFRSLIEIENINPYVLVSARRAARIRKGWRKPLPVRVRVNGKPEKPWRINLMPVGDGSFYLYLHGDVRRTGPGLVVFRPPEVDASVLRLRTTEDVFLLAWGTDKLTHRALDLDPDLIPVRLRVAEMLLEDKQAPDALPHLERLYRQAPDNPEVQARLGMCRYFLNQTEDARRLMEAALVHLPRAALPLLPQGEEPGLGRAGPVRAERRQRRVERAELGLDVTRAGCDAAREGLQLLGCHLDGEVHGSLRWVRGLCGGRQHARRSVRRAHRAVHRSPPRVRRRSPTLWITGG